VQHCATLCCTVLVKSKLPVLLCENHQRTVDCSAAQCTNCHCDSNLCSTAQLTCEWPCTLLGNRKGIQPQKLWIMKRQPAKPGSPVILLLKQCVYSTVSVDILIAAVIFTLTISFVLFVSGSSSCQTGALCTRCQERHSAVWNCSACLLSASSILCVYSITLSAVCTGHQKSRSWQRMPW